MWLLADFGLSKRLVTQSDRIHMQLNSVFFKGQTRAKSRDNTGFFIILLLHFYKILALIRVDSKLKLRRTQNTFVSFRRKETYTRHWTIGQCKQLHRNLFWHVYFPNFLLFCSHLNTSHVVRNLSSKISVIWLEQRKSLRGFFIITHPLGLPDECV